MNEAMMGDRRPIAARGSGFAPALTVSQLRTSITPNQISLLSIGFAALGAWALWQARPWLFLAALAGIQLRLLCNLLDRMVAVEGGRGSPLVAPFNEFPDRVAAAVLPAREVLLATTWAVLLGALLTCATRTRLIAEGLRAR